MRPKLTPSDPKRRAAAMIPIIDFDWVFVESKLFPAHSKTL